MRSLRRFRYSAVPAAGLVVALSGSPSITAHAAQPDCGVRCVRVRVVTAALTDFSQRIALTGDIEAKFQSNIAFRVNGKIATRLVDVGDHVTRDQVLARLDPRDQKANFDTTQAALNSAKALLAQAKVGFERQKTLYAQGFTTKPSYDQAEQTLRTQQAAVLSGEAALGTAHEQLGYTNLVAGADGIVVSRNAETGQVVQAGTTVFAIAQDGARDAVFDVYEALLAGPPGDGKVTVMLGTDLDVRTTGTVREISPNVDATSGTVKVKVQLAQTPPRMALGSAVIGTAAFAPKKSIVIPGGALFYWRNKPAVWLVGNANKAEPKPIGIDRYSGSSIVVSEGIAAGDRVIVSGIQFLRPGQQVEIAAEAPR